MKFFSLIPFLLMTLVATEACGSAEDTFPVPPAPQQPDSGHEDGGSGNAQGRTLVLYCSRTGNTRDVARHIAAVAGCDIAEVTPATAYDNDYNAMLARAREELAAIDRGTYPDITAPADGIDRYDTFIIGYPIWYGRAATPMLAFLHDNSAQLAGKRVLLFATSGSSGITASAREIGELCPDAEIQRTTLLLTSSSLQHAGQAAEEWLRQTGIISEEQDDTSHAPTVQIRIGRNTLTATLEDNATARDLISRLPLKATLKDYANGTEKIFYPSPELDIEGVERGCRPTEGDITIYEPCGNVAIFCKDAPYSKSLIRIGRIDGNGIEALKTAGDIEAEFSHR